MDFAAAVDRHYAGLVQRLTLVLHDAEEAQDVAQDAYARAFEAWDRFDGTDGPRGAVETMNPGRIWYTEKMAPAEREPGTCLLAGLMLYKEPADQDK